MTQVVRVDSYLRVSRPQSYATYDDAELAVRSQVKASSSETGATCQFYRDLGNGHVYEAWVDKSDGYSIKWRIFEEENKDSDEQRHQVGKGSL